MPFLPLVKSNMHNLVNPLLLTPLDQSALTIDREDQHTRQPEHAQYTPTMRKSTP
jgi:hypothetical protein